MNSFRRSMHCVSGKTKFQRHEGDFQPQGKISLSCFWLSSLNPRSNAWQPGTQMTSRTFADRFCERYKVAADSFETEMLQRSLYPAGKIVRLLLKQDSSYFVLDR